MLGFAIVDSQPTANATAVWLTSHIEGSQVNHTNAVVIQRDDERHDIKIWNLTADRAVVLTNDSASPIAFEQPLSLDAIDALLQETSVHQQLITDAVANYAARNKNRSSAAPIFRTMRPEFRIDSRDEPGYRALSSANYVRDAWSTWLATDEQRMRRVIDSRTGKPSGIMPNELASPTLADFPPEFGQIVRAQPLVKPHWVA